MAGVVVVGGGLGGLASAARLAKLGHQVTLVDAGQTLGGALRPVERDDYMWDSAATYSLLPAVVRDLFRKSGRPIERELELIKVPVLREHRFADGSRVSVHGGSRAEQLGAFNALGPGLGDQWCDFVAAYADDWELIRRNYLERPWAPDVAPRELARRLLSRESLHRRITGVLADPRLREVAAFPHVYAGHDLRSVPAWLGTTSYVEQAFGGWTLPGGMATLATALTRRLATRGVTVLSGTVTDLVVRHDRVVAVRIGPEELAADAVVVAVDPRRLPALAPHVRRTIPVTPPATTYLGLSGEVPALAPETAVHGAGLLVVRTGGRAPSGHHAWTLQHRGSPTDPVEALAARGIDVREQVVVRIDRTPVELVADWGGSPDGLLWQGRRTIRDRLGPRTPIGGVYAAGAHAAPGGGLPFVGLSAALVAQAIGPAT
ncbi:phytoene desaturase family protein [Nocardioides sp.]|uniref:phytoene desaturase family protein n=1 Tax=Nocardioides sp. TaxID=35761 RepID=UPI003D147AED